MKGIMSRINYDQDQLTEICNSFDLADYVAQNYYLKGNGPEYMTSCLRHKDVKPSLAINSANNQWFCHSCHKGGGPIQWLMLEEGMTFLQAVEKLQKLTGRELKVTVPTTSMQLFKKIKALDVTGVPNQREFLSDDYLNQFQTVENEPHEWIEEGILPETMRFFEVYLDPKANRIVYAVRDSNGNLIGVKGRTRFENYKLLGITKYINYTKVGSTDYFQGMYQNKSNILAKRSMIVVEGLKSVMKLYQMGYDTAVAAETSYLNDAQARIILEMGVDEVTFAFDQDVTYQDALKSINKVKQWTNCYVVIDNNGLLQPKDSPCDEGKEVWEKLYADRKRVL